MEGEEVVVEDDLSNFREQWKKELGGKSENESEESSQERELQEKVEDQEDDIHVQVKINQLNNDVNWQKY